MVKCRRLVLIFSALLIGSGILAWSNVTLVPSVHAANLSISLVGSFSAWNSSTVPNPTITVTQGDVVSISLTSGDITHQFALDVDKDGPKFIGSCPSGDKCSSTFAPGSPTMATINASFAPGTYTYFCTFHSSMVGSFVVNPSSTVGGTVAAPDKLLLVAPYIVLASALAAVVAVGAYSKRNRWKPAK